MAVQQVSVSVDQSKLDRLAHVVEEMRRAGLNVDQQLDAIGVVTGSIDPDQIDKLRKVTGVAAVEPDLTFQLPDPGSPIQ
jgi:hypothetical protein